MKLLLLLLITFFSLSAAINEEFNSMSELKQNWWISRWGQTAKQYDTNMVTIEDSILRLTMEPDSLDGKPRPLCSEITYTSKKFLYGSFRASIKTTGLSGGVVGWFVYKDGVPGDGNLHEVDMEILTEDITQIQYTLHHDAYSVDHYIDPLSFDPSQDFHEYRFDWYPDSVSYYIDGVHRRTLIDSIPNDSCAIMFNYWSNNNQYWGGDMPDTTTHMWVDYMRYRTLEELNATTVNSIQIHKSKSFFKTVQNEVSITVPKTGNYHFEVYQLNGKKIFTKEISSDVKIDLSSFTGAVIMELRGEGVVLQEKTILK